MMQKEFTQVSWDEATELDCRQLVRLWIHEDLGRQHDWTTLALISPEAGGRAAVVTREKGFICGMEATRIALDEMDIDCEWSVSTRDGEQAEKGAEIAIIEGQARDLLTAERLVLNLIGHLSGVATLTNSYVSRISDSHASIYDTRKTLPGWRRLEKYAVRCGGGKNHRSGLFDAILIKDNHLAHAAASSTVDNTPVLALRKARRFLEESGCGAEHDLIIEIEVESLDQLIAVLPEHPDIVLLDNMSPQQLQEAVQIRDRNSPGVELEASGHINFDSIVAVARSGVDRISIGALTHSARHLDVGLDWRFPTNTQ